MSSNPLPPPIEKIKEGMRATWMAGDFGMVARTIARGGEEFVAALQLPPAPAKVLDIATGTGNLAVPLAALGYDVTGVDIAPNLLEQARERAAAAGLTIQFDEGDAEAMPYADESFDVVVSMFGAMFAPRPALVAAECARVLKPGGLLAMANWTPGGFTGRMFRLGAGHVPPPPGIDPPVRWGDPATVRERLGAGFESIEFEVIPIDFDMPTPPSGAVEFFRKYFGPTQVAFSRLTTAGQVAFTGDLTHLWTEANVSGDPNRTLVKNEYLKVTARKK
ncbi:Methyltransferase domain-containing protein [Bryocella elongata]|uniref:Methyltransferase domain-containing protein n=1 Tax=Bryocella elongata TaxID=863522 RepID=A0A1H5YDE4_9BACT|nr:class I SAM-dependent methyltransferase [Bryocella elongata]SEG22073.1 Methyltransferase domain-containing protein [Bryocella elongata]